MKAITHKFWNKIKNRADIWFFFGFLSTFPLSTRKVLFFYPIQGIFNEYTAVYFYISDIFLLCAVLSFFLLRNNNKLLSIYTTSPFNSSKNTYFYIPLGLVILSFISAYWAHSQAIAIYRSIKLLESYLIYLYITLRFIPHQLFHVEQLKNRNSSIDLSSNEIVPRGTIGSNQGPGKGYFYFEKLGIKKLWLIYASLLIQVGVLLFAFYKSTILGLLVAVILIVIENNCSTWNNLIRQHIRSFPQKESSIVPRGTIGKITANFTSTLFAKNCSTWNNFMKIIISLGLIESIIAIWQFILQHSIGLFWLKESFVSANIPGVAKVILNGHTCIRAYGLFPHPNILGGFLLFSIIVTILYKSIIILSDGPIVPRGTIGSNQGPGKDYFYFEKLGIKKLWLIYGLLFIQLLALLLTFSKSAILGLLIAFAYVSIKTHCSTWNNVVEQSQKSFSQKETSIVPRGTINVKLEIDKLFTTTKKLFHVEQLRKIILFILIIFALLLITKPNIYVLLFKSLNERLFYLNVSYKAIANNPLFGIGSGQFVLNIPAYTKEFLESWQFQPVHNVFLLIWNELGIVGLGLFIWLLLRLFHACLPARQVEQLKNRNSSTDLLSDTIVPRGTIGSDQGPGKGYFYFEKLGIKKLWLIYASLLIQVGVLLFAFYKSVVLGLLVAVILIVIENKCSTWNIALENIKKLLGLKSKSIVPRGTMPNNLSASRPSQTELKDNIILCNDIDLLSIRTVLLHLQGVLLGFIFIMLFDHYFWDIWPGQVMLWLIMGMIAGIKTFLDRTYE